MKATKDDFSLYSLPNIRSLVHQCMTLQRRHFITAQGLHVDIII